MLLYRESFCLHKQPPIQWVPVDLFPGVKLQGREADRTSRSSAELKNGGALPRISSSPYVFLM
jgi:hypothetical protein